MAEMRKSGEKWLTWEREELVPVLAFYNFREKRLTIPRKRVELKAGSNSGSGEKRPRVRREMVDLKKGGAGSSFSIFREKRLTIPRKTGGAKSWFLFQTYWLGEKRLDITSKKGKKYLEKGMILFKKCSPKMHSRYHLQMKGVPLNTFFWQKCPCTDESPSVTSRYNCRSNNCFLKTGLVADSI